MASSTAAQRRRLLLAVGVALAGTALWSLRGGVAVGDGPDGIEISAPGRADRSVPDAVSELTAPFHHARTVTQDLVHDTPPVDVAPDTLSTTVAPEDTRVQPVYTFWDESGGPPMLDDELTLTLVEAADGVAREPWSVSVDLSAVRTMQPKYSVAMPLPVAGLYRATCRDGAYHPADVWVPNVQQPRVAIVLQSVK